MEQPRYHYYQFNYTRHNLVGERFAKKWLESIDFSRAIAPGIDFRGSQLREIDFSGADLTSACFAQARLHDVRFNGAILRDATFADAELSDVSFSGAVLQGTDLARATLRRNVYVDNPQQWTKPTLSADGALLAWFEERKQQIWLWKLFASEQGQVLATPSTKVHALFFHPLTHLLVSVHANHSIVFWDADARQRLHHLQLTSAPWWEMARDVPFSPNGQWFVIPAQWSEQGACLFLWDLAQMCVKQKFPANGGDPFAFSPESTLLAIGRKEHIEIWDLASGALHRQVPLKGVRELTFQASGQALFVLADRLYQVEVATGALLDPLLDEHPGHTRPVTSAVFSPNGYLLATYDGATVQVWEVPSGKHLLACAGRRALFSPDGSWLAVLTSGGNIQHWDCATWSVTHTFKVDASTDELLFSPDGQVLLCFSGTHSVSSFTVWPEYEMTMDDDWYYGHFALYQSTSGIPFWPDLAKQTQKPGGPTPAVWRASFSPDSRWLTILTEDDDRGTLKWSWDLATGAAGPSVKPDKADRAYEHSRQSLDHHLPASSPDGRWQVRADGHHVQIWDQEQQHLIVETSQPPNAQTIYPAWHDQRVALGLVNAQETWRDLLAFAPPAYEALEQTLIAHKLAFEYCQEVPPHTLPRGSRQEASWHAIQERTLQPSKQILAVVHKDGALSVFHASTGQYQQMYNDPLRPENSPG